MTIADYERHMAEARNGFAEHDAFRRAISGASSPRELSLVLVEYTSRSVKMTEPVERWIRRAGERCIALGMTKIGQSLVRHAAQEAGHHLMLIADAHALARRHNHLHGTTIDAEAWIARDRTSAMRSYAELHESVISSGEPYGQIAIELEIEQLSLTAGKAFLEVCQRSLGLDAEGLSFLREHVEVDVAHTKLNQRLLRDVITEDPQRTASMVATGRRALAIFGEFLNECCAVT